MRRNKLTGEDLPETAALVGLLQVYIMCGHQIAALVCVKQALRKLNLWFKGVPLVMEGQDHH